MKQDEKPRRVLAVCAVDLMAWKLLMPWLTALRGDGYEVHVACAKTEYFEQLAAAGFHLHDVRIRRRMNPLVNLQALWQLYRLMKRERFDVVNTHSPVAAAIGRLAAWLASSAKIAYTVHGFYFHDDMPVLKRRSFVLVERLLGMITDSFMFVSEEDRQSAIKTGIAGKASATTIYNGVDLGAFQPREGPSVEGELSAGASVRRDLGIAPDATVVGIVGRVVREKGYIEFVEMAAALTSTRNDVYFLVVGDALPSDRDGIVTEVRRLVESSGMSAKFRYTGFTDQVGACLQAMDIFVLPSYREGFPRSVLEAMSCGLPVVATNIRGCREAVVDGQTGFIVPPRDSAALAKSVGVLLDSPALAREMGYAGRARAVLLFDQRLVQERFVRALNDLAAIAAP